MKLLNVRGCTITIDAMGCQTEIAKQIVNADAGYALVVKGNRPSLHERIVNFFADHLDDDLARTKVRRYEMKEKGHGGKSHAAIIFDRLPTTCRIAGAELS